jgi:hypothetical protein
VHSSSHHRSDGLRTENGHLVATTDFPFGDIDARLGWSESPSPDQQSPVAQTSDEHAGDQTDVDVEQIPIAPQSEAIIKILCRLLAAENTYLELLTLCSAFALQALLGGKSFTLMAREAGVSRQRFSKHVLEIQKEFNLRPSRGQKSIESRQVYRETQLTVWQRPERKPDQILKMAKHFGCARSYRKKLGELS